MDVGSSSFRVYYSPPAISESPNDDVNEGGPVVFVCHHGAGYSAMTFALLAEALQSESNGQAGVLALDARAHGEVNKLFKKLRPGPTE